MREGMLRRVCVCVHARVCVDSHRDLIRTNESDVPRHLSASPCVYVTYCALCHGGGHPGSVQSSFLFWEVVRVACQPQSLQADMKHEGKQELCICS